MCPLFQYNNKDLENAENSAIQLQLPDDHPDTALYTLYLSLEDMEYNDEYSHGHYDFSEDDDYEKGARSLVTDCMNDLGLEQ